MAIADVQCNVCWKTFVAAAAVQVSGYGRTASHICRGCTYDLLVKLKLPLSTREEVMQSWPK